MKQIVFKNGFILKIEKRFNSFSIREKLLILMALVAVIYSGWHTVLYDYILATDEEVSKKASEIKQQISLLEGQIDSISEVLGRDPTVVLQQEAGELRRKNEALTKEIYENTKKMVSPKDMNKVLSNLIQKSVGLTVVSMESLPTKPLFAAKSIEINGGMRQLQVFNHGLRVELVGNYFDTLQFLKALEQQSLNVMWDELEYEVKKYPKANIAIIFHTLSLKEGWIDV